MVRTAYWFRLNPFTHLPALLLLFFTLATCQVGSFIAASAMEETQSGVSAKGVHVTKRVFSPVKFQSLSKADSTISFLPLLTEHLDSPPTVHSFSSSIPLTMKKLLLMPIKFTSTFFR